MRRRINRVKGILAGKGGFTLLELIVVIAIVGFLAAMVAPRFAGIVHSAVDPVCDTNQQRLVNAIGAFTEKEHELPNELVNVAYGTPGGAVVYAGRLHDCLVEHNQLKNHVLNEAEATELREEMGITHIRDIDGAFTPVASGTMVAMVGVGADKADVTGLRVATGVDIHYGEYDHIARILLGVCVDSELVDKGYITAAGLCPGGLQEGVFNNYVLVVPRLDATVARLAEADKVIGGIRGLDEDKEPTGQVVIDHRLEGQDYWVFDTQCAEGCAWPPDPNEYWEIVTP
ncbi:prepilin-type N-terminal cleavage/methylation domain-containing protein [Peptococcaceae bacterium]|nr:prepilin-type N-terminal cleavage/methylation domain-containing protein [Peptococcaceae bacterium]